MKTVDSVCRLYNLHMMGVMLFDPLGMVKIPMYTEDQPLRDRVVRFIQSSEKVWNLEDLACLKFKCMIGPKRFVEKLLNLYRGGFLTKILVQKMGSFNTTDNLKLVSDDMMMPDKIFYEFNPKPALPDIV